MDPNDQDVSDIEISFISKKKQKLGMNEYIINNITNCLFIYFIDKTRNKELERANAAASKILKEINMTPHGDAHVEKFGEGDLHGISFFQFIKLVSNSCCCGV